MVWKTVDGEKDLVKMRNYQLDWMKDRRKNFIEKMGPCVFCGETEFEKMAIHHLDPNEKIDHKIWSWSPERIESELIKCVSMCQKCHRQFHALLMKKCPEHGTLHAYGQYKCRCEKCREAKAEEARKYRAMAK